jgi:hypothetical protein
MKQMTKMSKMFLAMWAISFAAGCQTLLINPVGRTVPENKRLALRDSGEWTGTYQNEDLVLTYIMRRTAGLLNISGRIQFTRRIAENFPVVVYFHLDAILIDSQGRALTMTGLTSVSNYSTEYITPSDPPFTFNARISIPENAESLAFSYTGQAYDPTEHGGPTDFWEYPFK